MSVIPILGSAQPAVEAASKSPTFQGSGKMFLNVYLHGMFAVVFDKTKQIVQLLPPSVGGSTPHIYLAGDMQSPPFRLQPGGYYSAGLPKIVTNPPKIDPTQNVVVNVSGNIKPGNGTPHCTIELPFPNNFYPLRTVAPPLGKFIFDNPTGLSQPPVAVPLVSMLQYQLPSPCPSSDPCYLKFHFYAEPSICPAEFHTADAFHQLKLLFYGLDYLKVNSDLGLDEFATVTEPIPGAQVGASLADKYALVEWLGLKCADIPPTPKILINAQGKPAHKANGGDFAIHPTACMSMIATVG